MAQGRSIYVVRFVYLDIRATVMSGGATVCRGADPRLTMTTVVRGLDFVGQEMILDRGVGSNKNDVV
jgi:hypothetical protein